MSERILVLEKWKQCFNKILNLETQQAKSNYFYFFLIITLQGGSPAR